jgi:hypothetical protein
MPTVSLHNPLHALPWPTASSARGIFGLRVGSGCGWSDSDYEFGAEVGRDARQDGDGRHGSAASRS